ncbi:MAG: hypothetical protein PF570_06805 [Candidatus Cloacimonetes bacterium]|nr:hypothetical protein [Candidatus Cloacimonadota bacterium]
MKAKNIPFIPDGAEINEETLKIQESCFFEILEEILAKVKKFDVTLRVVGSIAFRLKCPDYKYIAYKNQRFLNDIDFIVYSKDIIKVQDIFFELGWSENQNILRLFGDKRRIFYHPDKPVHSDIFINKLRFCHEIDFRKRLEIDNPTISLIDLLLGKLQIVEINKRDIIDMMVLLSQYPISTDGNNNGYINGEYLAKLCSNDWGWWKTTNLNIEKTYKLSDEYLNKENAKKIKDKLGVLSQLIDEKPKSLKWKLRAIIGEKKRWYREVEEVERG